MSLVLDASATIAWFMPDEQGRGSQELLDKVTVSGAIVPTLWKLEVGNALLLAEKRGRVTAVQREEALNQLLELSIVTDNETAAHAGTLH